MVFGASVDVSGLPESKPEIKMVDVMQKAWAAFARDPKVGLKEEMGWPVFDPDCKFSLSFFYFSF